LQVWPVGVVEGTSWDTSSTTSLSVKSVLAVALEEADLFVGQTLLKCLVGFEIFAIGKCASGVEAESSIEVFKIAVCASTAIG
jgi:hypothetical protein